MSLSKVDHITICTSRIRQLAWLLTEKLGARMVLRCDDVYPESPSSMKLWCFEFVEMRPRSCATCGTAMDPAKLGVALVEGIDREEVSQVTRFVQRHGDGFVQHIAFDVGNLADFLGAATMMNMRGRPQQREDVDGPVRQIFAKGLVEGDPAETFFFEFIERPIAKNAFASNVMSFSALVGERLYEVIEEARRAKDHQPMLDLSAVPTDWEPRLFHQREVHKPTSEVTVLLEQGDSESWFLCLDISSSGVFVEVAPPFSIGDTLRVRGLRIGEDYHALDLKATVAWSSVGHGAIPAGSSLVFDRTAAVDRSRRRSQKLAYRSMGRAHQDSEHPH